MTQRELKLLWVYLRFQLTDWDHLNTPEYHHSRHQSISCKNRLQQGYPSFESECCELLDYNNPKKSCCFVSELNGIKGAYEIYHLHCYRNRLWIRYRFCLRKTHFSSFNIRQVIVIKCCFLRVRLYFLRSWRIVMFEFFVRVSLRSTYIFNLFNKFSEKTWGVFNHDKTHSISHPFICVICGFSSDSNAKVVTWWRWVCISLDYRKTID